jgi:hypothetical protein
VDDATRPEAIVKCRRFAQVEGSRTKRESRGSYIVTTESSYGCTEITLLEIFIIQKAARFSEGQVATVMTILVAASCRPTAVRFFANQIVSLETSEAVLMGL